MGRPKKDTPRILTALKQLKARFPNVARKISSRAHSSEGINAIKGKYHAIQCTLRNVTLYKLTYIALKNKTTIRFALNEAVAQYVEKWEAVNGAIETPDVDDEVTYTKQITKDVVKAPAPKKRGRPKSTNRDKA